MRRERDDSLTKLMRYFVKDEGNGGADSQRQTLRDGCTQRQAVGKVVNSISHNDEPCQWLYPHHSTYQSTLLLLKYNISVYF